MKSPEYIVYQYLGKSSYSDKYVPHCLLILCKCKKFGLCIGWENSWKKCRIKKRLTKKLVENIYNHYVHTGDIFCSFDNDSAPYFSEAINKLFSLANKESRIERIKYLDKLEDEKKLIYYQEL